jgi:hypothetical protein
MAGIYYFKEKVIHIKVRILAKQVSTKKEFVLSEGMPTFS